MYMRAWICETFYHSSNILHTTKGQADILTKFHRFYWFFSCWILHKMYARTLTKPMAADFSRKHWRQRSRPYLRMRPAWCAQRRLVRDKCDPQVRGTQDKHTTDGYPFQTSSGEKTKQRHASFWWGTTCHKISITDNGDKTDWQITNNLVLQYRSGLISIPSRVRCSFRIKVQSPIFGCGFS